MITPRRPDSVPEGAQFGPDPDDPHDRCDYWLFGESGPVGRTGPWRYWRPDGRLYEEDHYVDGKLHGRCRTFHDDGTVGFDNVWDHGRVVVMQIFRSENPSSLDLGSGFRCAAVWSVCFETDGQGHTTREVFLDRSGREIDSEGELLPSRPQKVPADAWYLRAGPQTGWQIAHWDRVNNTYRGPRINWSSDGELARLEYHFGEPSRKRWDGIIRGDKGANRPNPLVEAARVEDWDAVDLLLTYGAGTSPGAAEQADFEGLSELARRIRGAGEPVESFADPREEPAERPASVPLEARWVARMNGWLRSELTDGIPTGVWTCWENDRNPVTVEIEFADGNRTTRTERFSNGERHKQEIFAPDGSVRVERKYEDDVVEEETEHLVDGSVAERRFDDGKLAGERITADGVLVEERWWRADGSLAAVVSPSDRLYKGEPVELWRAFDQTGILVVEGRVEPGMEGGTVGRWKLLDADGGLRGKVVLKGYRRSADLGELALGLAAVASATLVEPLAGVDEVPWPKLESVYWGDGEFPLYLRALTMPDITMARWGLEQIDVQCLHQHTIGETTGPVVRFICQLLAAGAQHPDLTADLLVFALRCASNDGSWWISQQARQGTLASWGRPLKKARKADQELGGYFVEMFRALADHWQAWHNIVETTEDESQRRMGLHLLALAPSAEANRALRECVPVYEAAIREGSWVELELSELLLCLGVTDDPADLDILRGYLADDRPKMRFAAARSWVRRGGEVAAALGPLLDGLTSQQLGGWGECYLSVGSDAATEAASALGELPPQFSEQAVDRLCAVLRDAGLLDCDPISSALLSAVFLDEGYDERNPLTPAQRKAIQTICDTPHAWKYANTPQILRYHNLPDGRDALRALLS